MEPKYIYLTEFHTT